MSEEIAFLHRQAARCRRLARESSDPVTAEQLDDLAADYEKRAAALEAEQDSGSNSAVA